MKPARLPPYMVVGRSRWRDTLANVLALRSSTSLRVTDPPTRDPRSSIFQHNRIMGRK
jgi:hypothetical protein